MSESATLIVSQLGEVLLVKLGLDQSHLRSNTFEWTHWEAGGHLRYARREIDEATHLLKRFLVKSLPMTTHLLLGTSELCRRLPGLGNEEYASKRCS